MTGPISGAAVAYLIGSVPAARVVSRLSPDRPWTPWAAALADVLKGYAAVTLVMQSGSVAQALLVTALVAGDQWPVIGASFGRPGHWAFLGAIAAITPIAPLIWVLFWGLGFVASGYFAIGRLVGTVVLPIALGFVAGWPLGGIALPGCVMLVDRSREALRRVRSGEESKHYWRGEA